MKTRLTACLLAAIVLSTAITGCAPTGDGSAAAIVQVEERPLLTVTPGEQNPTARTAAQGANDFAFRLSAALAQEAGEESFVVSPYSVWLPLAALLNATDEANQEALLAVLGASGITAADVNQAASRMLFDLTNEGEREFAEEFDFPHHSPLRIANAIFVSDQVSLRRDFAQTFADYYRGSAFEVDFLSQEAVDAINQWAYDHTEGLITDLVEEFDPDTVAAIANAIYFSDQWSREFNPADTSEGIFHSPAGELPAYFMHSLNDWQFYYEDEILQATRLGFATGGGMFILLPHSGDATALLSDMTAEYFDHIQNNGSHGTVQLQLPRFSVESTFNDLCDVLIRLGVPLFDEQSAPLTGGLIYDNLRVWLSEAMQKAVIEVDEEGTTAAAVTVLVAVAESAPDYQEPFVMICDRPFVFVLYQRTNDGARQVLFTGVLNQP